MNPWDISTPTIDLPAVAAWNAAIERSRREYRAHPIVSWALCEKCGRTARVTPCGRCERAA